MIDKKLYIHTPKKKLHALLDFDYLTCFVLLNNQNPENEFSIRILGSSKIFKLRALSKVELDVWMKVIHSNINRSFGH